MRPSGTVFELMLQPAPVKSLRAPQFVMGRIFASVADDANKILSGANRFALVLFRTASLRLISAIANYSDVCRTLHVIRQLASSQALGIQFTWPVAATLIRGYS